MSVKTINQIIELIEGDRSYQDIFKKFTNNQNIDDFKQFIYLILLEQSEKTLKAFIMGYLKFYFVQIVSNQIKSHNSKWHYQYRKDKFNQVEINNIELVDEKAEELTDLKTDIYKIISKKISDKPKLLLHFNLFSMYHFDNFTYQQIEEKLNIPYSSVRNYILLAKNIIKKELKHKYTNN